MRTLLSRVGLVVLASWLGSCAAGIVVAQTDTQGAASAVRDVAVVILAILLLVLALVLAVVYGAAAWAVGRFEGLGVRGVSWAKRKTLWTEDRAAAAVERALVRPVARAARLFTAAGTLFVRLRPMMADEAGTARPHPAAQHDTAVRAVSSLKEQVERSEGRPD